MFTGDVGQDRLYCAAGRCNLIELVRNLHIACAGLALGLFVWRGHAMWQERPVRAILWRRIIPDSIDTVLMVTGISLIVMLEQYPFVETWITVKLALLLAYIGLGFVALDLGKSIRIRKIAWLLALTAFAGILITVRYRGVLFT